MAAYQVHPLFACAIAFAERHYPENLPKRWHFIAEFVQGNLNNLLDAGTTQCSITIGKSKKGCRVINAANINHIDCKSFFQLIRQQEPSLLQDLQITSRNFWTESGKDGHKQIILTCPSSCETEGCCNYQIKKSLVVRNRPSFPIIYCINGPVIAAAYSGHCTKCSTTYYSTYREVNGTRTYYGNALDKHYLQTSSTTGFELEYLKLLTNEVAIGGVSFESCADIYNTTHRDKIHRMAANEQQTKFARAQTQSFELYERRVDEAWYVYNLLQYINDNDCPLEVVLDVDASGTRRDIEGMCKDIYENEICKDSKWADHKCTVAGCSEGYVSIDGNEKIRRPMCAAPKTAVKLGKGMPRVIQCCPESPIVGNRYGAANEYCQEHSKHLAPSQPKKQKTTTTDTRADTEPNIVVTISLRDMELNPKYITSTADLPDNDDESLMVGCKQKQNVDRFFNRSAGILAMIRPCGMIVDFTELFTCESATQVFIFLIRTCSRNWKRYSYIGYDRACELHPFLVNLAKKGNVAAMEILQNLKFVVDLFHCLKHKKKTCMPLENNPDCKYHPRLPQHASIAAVNTQCAEQSFKWLNKFKWNVRRMSQYKYKFFLSVVVNARNIHTQNRLNKRGSLL